MWMNLGSIATAVLLFAPALLGADSNVRGATAATNRSFTIPAWAFDRGNAKTFTSDWADAGPMVAFGGKSPVVIEYDLEFPVAADYTVSVLYAAGSARPVSLSLDGEKVGECCRAATGGWNTSGAKWGEAARTSMTKGKHTLKLERTDAFPHVVSLCFGGPDLSDMYVATGGDAAHPGKGGIVRIKPGVRGLMTYKSRRRSR